MLAIISYGYATGYFSLSLDILDSSSLSINPPDVETTDDTDIVSRRVQYCYESLSSPDVEPARDHEEVYALPDDLVFEEVDDDKETVPSINPHQIIEQVLPLAQSLFSGSQSKQKKVSKERVQQVLNTVLAGGSFLGGSAVLWSLLHDNKEKNSKGDYF